LSEITQLFAVANRELNDACAQGLSADGKFMHAYDAALTLCQIALRASGYRVNRKQHGHHQKTIESLPLTVGEDQQGAADLVVVASRQRSQALYARIDVVSSQDADELFVAACKLRADVVRWLAAANRRLLPKSLAPESQL
jgi:hypothetical protein